jgi:ferritin-like metal-binding protein YciE
MPKEPKTLDDLFHDTLKDIYFAEKKIVTTLPKMAKAAQHPQLKMAFEKHLKESEGHVKRLEQVFGIIGKKPQGKTCDAIVGITEEGAEIIKDYKGTPALDAGLIGAAQAVEHYEISRYGTLRTWAEELGFADAASLLQATLDEEKNHGPDPDQDRRVCHQPRRRSGVDSAQQEGCRYGLEPNRRRLEASEGQRQGAMGSSNGR